MIDISAIIPAYNVVEYIGEALESAIRQDPPFKQIIVVDDGSTDGTANVVASFNNPRIEYHHQENRGLGPTRNAGMELADGEYLYFMDGDDVLCEGMTEFVAKAVAAAPGRLDALFFSATNFWHETGESADSRYFHWRCAGTYVSGRDALVAAVRSGRFPVCAFTYVARRDVIEGHPQLRFRSILHEDEIFTPELLLRCGPTLITNQAVYRRRLRKGSIMHSPKAAGNIIGNLVAARLWQKLGDMGARDEQRLFRLKAWNFYRGAVRGAAKAHIEWDAFERMIVDSGFECGDYARRDYRVAALNRHLASAMIRRRSRRLVGGAN